MATQHVMIVMLYLSETRRDDGYASDSVLFVSETNSVDVKFTSDKSSNYPGFTLDVRSIDCADRARYPLAGNSFCNAPNLFELGVGQTLEGVIAMETDSNGKYLSNTVIILLRFYG